MLEFVTKNETRGCADAEKHGEIAAEAEAVPCYTSCSCCSQARATQSDETQTSRASAMEVPDSVSSAMGALLDSSFLDVLPPVCEVSMAHSITVSSPYLVLRLTLQPLDAADPSFCAWQEKLQKAKDLYERALRLQPQHVPAICNYAALMSQVAGKLDKAHTLYQRAAALDPNDPNVLCNLGNLKREHKDDLAGAEGFYKKALAVDPAHIQTLLSYGHQVALHSEDYDRAEQLLQHALRIQPGNADGEQGLEWIRNMRQTFGRASPVESAGPAASRLRMEWERRKSLKAATSAVEYIDPRAEAKADSMAKLLLEEEENEDKENKQNNRGGAKKSKKKKR